MKEKRNYKRFDLLSALAVLGCIGMLLFEGIFVLELYDRAVEQPAVELPAEAPAPSIEAPVAPVLPTVPVEVPPAQIDTAPASVPVG